MGTSRLGMQTRPLGMTVGVNQPMEFFELFCQVKEDSLLFPVC